MLSSRSSIQLGLSFVAVVCLGAGAAAADTLTFQQGDGGAYSETAATSITYDSAVNFGSYFIVHIVTFDLDEISQAFIRFPDIVGSNPGQIPPGSTITSAVLGVTIYNGPMPQASTTYIHKVYAAWDENTVTGISWNALPGTTYGPSLGTIPGGLPLTLVSGDVTSIVQDWTNGDANWGVMLRIPGGTDFVITQYYSDDAAEQTTRPRLTVEFTPPNIAVAPTTWGKVKALYR